MSADTLPGNALTLALDAANGTYADGTPLSFADAILRGLLAASPSISDQQRTQIRELAVATGAVCTWHGQLRPFADLLGGTPESGGETAGQPEKVPDFIPGFIPRPESGPS